MRTNVYRRLAAEGIRKNRRLYFPYMLTGGVMVMMHYLLRFLSYSPIMKRVRGSELTMTVLGLGAIVIWFFALLFLYYTDSLLIRQRSREFGLYNILGMDKKNLTRVIIWENFISASGAVLGGLLFGILFSKLGELGFLRIMNLDATCELGVSVPALLLTVRIFLCIYLFLLVCSVVRVWRLDPLELLQSSRTGERPPKGRFLLTAAGLLLLGTAYYQAVTIEEPLTALMVFFAAVLMVIAATYILFVTGSVTLCRLLQKNKRYYYRPNHFVSVSSMAYRMKRNGAGLASICVLSTMILVMLSCTVTLYTGQEKALRQRYPRHINLELHVDGSEAFRQERIDGLQDALEEEREGAETQAPVRENVRAYRKAAMYAYPIDGAYTVNADDERVSDVMIGKEIQLFSLDDFNAIMGTEAVLEDDECMVYWDGNAFDEETISFMEGRTYRVKTVLDQFFESGFNSAISIVSNLNVVVKDLDGSVEQLSRLRSSRDRPWVELVWVYGYDIADGEKEEIADAEAKRLGSIAAQLNDQNGAVTHMTVLSRAGERQYDLALNGGLLFLGLILSIVFIIASVLIIYYKQISEGYEDQARFGIMQNVGMTKREIRASINSQILTVFFLPLLFAGCHLCFAFPLLWRIMRFFGCVDHPLFMRMTIVCFVVFGLCYAGVYKLTAGAYYRIVSSRDS